MKKIVVFLLLTVMLLGLAGCATKTLHCDGCGAEVKVEESSNMDESWLVYCEACNKEIEAELAPLWTE